MTKRLKSKDINRTNPSVDYLSYILLAVVLVITLATYPEQWSNVKVGCQHVWFYGWMTCISTGGGVLPFFFVSKPGKFWIGVSNGTTPD